MAGINLNTVAMAFLTAGVTASVAGFIAREIMHPHVPETPAYRISSQHAAASSGGAEKKGGGLEPVSALLASADAAAGQKAARVCTACHTFDKGGANRVGPNLWGIVGGPKAHVKTGFNYSSGLAGAGGNWTFEDLNHFIYAPSEFIKGTKMSYGGMKSVKERANIIAWLREQSDSPLPLP